MIDLKKIENEPEKVKELLARKGWEFDPEPLLEDFKKRRELLQEVETNKAEQNRLSKSVPQVKKEGGDVKAIFAKVKELSAKNESKEKELDAVNKAFIAFFRTCN